MEIMKKCPRCMGRGKMYRSNGGWSMVCTGPSEAVDCPMCLGKVFIKDVVSSKDEDVKEKLTEKEEIKPKLVKRKVKMGKPKKESANPEAMCT